jgi:MFS-type transporter involved in bile tolerance (Atg22 family)
MPPPGGAPPYGPPGGSPNPELKKQATTWLIVAAASALFCTCCFGIIGAVFCFMAMQAVDQGNIADAESKLKWGKIITIVGLVFGVLGTIISVVFYATEIAAAFSGAH